MQETHRKRQAGAPGRALVLGLILLMASVPCSEPPAAAVGVGALYRSSADNSRVLARDTFPACAGSDDGEKPTMTTFCQNELVAVESYCSKVQHL